MRRKMRAMRDRVLHVLVVRPPQQGFQFVKVHARAKSFAGACKYDDLRRRFLDFIKCSQQFFHQGATDSIALLLDD